VEVVDNKKWLKKRKVICQISRKEVGFCMESFANGKKVKHFRLTPRMSGRILMKDTLTPNYEIKAAKLSRKNISII